jgi:hypothetical protein
MILELQKQINEATKAIESNEKMLFECDENGRLKFKSFGDGYDPTQDEIPREVVKNYTIQRSIESGKFKLARRHDHSDTEIYHSIEYYILRCLSRHLRDVRWSMNASCSNEGFNSVVGYFNKRDKDPNSLTEEIYALYKYAAMVNSNDATDTTYKVEKHRLNVLKFAKLLAMKGV